MPATIAPPRRARIRLREWTVGLVILSAVVVAAVWMSSMRSQPSREAIALNNQGHDSLNSGRLQVARRHFQSALARSPRFAEAKLNLATVLHREGDDDAAAGLYGEVLREQPKRRELIAAAHYGLGEIDLQADAWPSAVAHLSAATLGDSARVEYPNNLAFALIRAGRTDEALATLRTAQQRFPGEPSLLKNAALAWFERARPDSALSAANAAVRLRPDFVAAWVLKTRSEAALGDLAAARASLATVERLGADESSVREAQDAVREAATPR
ncbi:MAG: tetratricopeptide repeat protein [Candidatus Eisenbacteria bacterium]|uniref:Tetratricopeptide repeat protein n=1 Tax=Eiseniibacteriota bacterium TaxID=2212470 RepID=A0A849SL53_UNCEI|nr:tetratricopeptide repeat protein [Candidatus Eisenbacteria bacterium]